MNAAQKIETIPEAEGNLETSGGKHERSDTIFPLDNHLCALNRFDLCGVSILGTKTLLFLVRITSTVTVFNCILFQVAPYNRAISFTLE
jgi:hypothetical protein